MCKAMEEMRNDVEQRTQLDVIRKIMEKLKYTAQQAMDLLDIPEEKKQKYLTSCDNLLYVLFEYERKPPCFLCGGTFGIRCGRQFIHACLPQ